MSIKGKIESHPLVFFLGTLLCGFLAGVATYQSILEIARLKVVPRNAESGVEAYKAEISRLQAENTSIYAQFRSCVGGDSPGGVEGDVGSSTVSDLNSRSGQPAQEESDYSEAPTYSAIDVAFTLKGCARSGTIVECSFSVINNGKDRDLYLFPRFASRRSRLFDDMGNEHVSVGAKLGKRQGDERVMKTMIHGIPIDSSFLFQGVSPDANYISVLEVWFSAGGNYPPSFKMRDIKFSE